MVHYRDQWRAVAEGAKDMSRFEWSDDYLTGDELIDTQHRQLFEFANVFFEVVARGEETAILFDAFETLLKYVEKHFNEEMNLYKRIGSALADMHRKKHADLAGELQLLWDDARHGLFDDDGQHLALWMETRLIPHVMEVDPPTLAARA